MSIKTIKYFSTIIVAVVAVLAGWWLWNYYMQSPWTRDGKIRAEQVSITPQVSGRIVELNIKDNQLVNAGDLLLTIDKTPFQIAELNAQAQLAKAQSDLAKANNEANALTLAAISCVLYSAVAAPFKSLSLLMRTLVLLSLFSFVVKFGLMVQISDLWQFLLFLFPLLATMQLLKLQMPKFAALWGQLIVFMGSFIAVTNPPVYDFADFLNDNLAKIVGVALAWLAFAILRPGSDARKSRRHIRALRRDFVDQLSRHPSLSESEFESLTYHHVSQLSNSQDAMARRWLLRWGVVLLNCSHVVWQLRDWESRSDPLSRVRDNCISLLRGVMSERGVQQKSLAATLEELQRICDSLARHHQPAARELAAIVWRLYCSLSQLEQAPPQGTLAS
ncbi:FUSC family protein [Escherichia coli]|nr:fusaric acid resistance family protein [Escherichia coli]EFD1620040.1 biotin/lipoyl-binding protein [Escherichia coli]EFD7614403.1 biotin/lipoyl-binding protein [Escherichia coli]EFG8636251.1 biotin/lipoyl-binding protein [Escherichia coli]EGD9763655.1 biotin/lipoyl-binding protein [Escherichia coli]